MPTLFCLMYKESKASPARSMKSPDLSQQVPAKRKTTHKELLNMAVIRSIPPGVRASVKVELVR